MGFTTLQKLPKSHASRLEYPFKLILTSIKRTFEKKILNLIRIKKYIF